MPPDTASITKALIVVVGPTAVGKTALSLRLAQDLRTVIISADARQLYHGMAIGTAQPTQEERQRVPHHFVDCLPVQASYSAGHFERDALALLAQLFAQHDQVLMTGGSGMYVQAVCEGLDAMPPVAPQLRAQLNARLQQQGLAALQQQLAALDPDYYRTVDRQNPRRIVRALEVALTTGQPYTTFRKRVHTARPFRIIKIGLTLDRQTLYERIDQRADAMWAQGLLQEAEALYPHRDCNALQTVGYREAYGHLAGAYGQAEAIRLLKRNTHRYAKRQMTWFGRDEAISWFHPADWDALRTYIRRHLETSAPPLTLPS